MEIPGYLNYQQAVRVPFYMRNLELQCRCSTPTSDIPLCIHILVGTHVYNNRDKFDGMYRPWLHMCKLSVVRDTLCLCPPPSIHPLRWHDGTVHARNKWRDAAQHSSCVIQLRRLLSCRGGDSKASMFLDVQGTHAAGNTHTSLGGPNFTGVRGVCGETMRAFAQETISRVSEKLARSATPF